ncbi:ice-binding family protein [Sphaerotilus sp.]|uniref:ice-binding family protein n=1 Tax=Sphaerotilus sp. TaxID=2093942 RepID=UPI0034E2A172
MHTTLIRHFRPVPKTIALAAVIALTALSAQAAPALGSAQTFAVLAGTTVTDAHSAPNLPTQIFGDLGTSPGASITGLTSGVNVNGGTVHANDPVAQTALTDATTAYNALSGLAFDTNLTGQVLGSPGLATLTPGVYRFDTSAQLTGTLVLDFLSNPGGNFVFQIGSTLTTASDSFISVLNASAGSGIYWQIGSSATLGTGTDFAGNLLALTSVTLDGGAQIVCGRAIGLSGAVTLADNLVSNDCSAQAFGTGLGDGGSLGFSGGPVTPVPEPATSMLFLAGLAGLGATRLKAWRHTR